MSGLYIVYPQPGSGSGSGGSPAPVIVGALDGASANANGATIGSTTLFMQSATGTFPGLVSSAAQTFAGIKTFSQAPQLSALTAGQAVVTGSGSVLTTLVYTALPTASTIMSRDINGNVTADNFVSAITTVQSSGTSQLLINAGSTRIQKIIGSNSFTITLPIATNLYSGQTYEINNNTTQTLPIVNQGSTSIANAVSGSYAYLICTDNSTVNGVWDVHWFEPSSAIFGTNGLQVTGSFSASSLTASLPVRTDGSKSLINGSISLTTEVSGLLPVANGGTGAATAGAAFDAISPITTSGDIIVGSGSNHAIRVGGNTAASSYFLIQSGVGGVAGIPSWTADGSILTNLNGTNISQGNVVVARGGTGAGTFTNFGVLVGRGTSPVSASSASSVVGQVLVGQGALHPKWLTLDQAAAPNTFTIGSVTQTSSVSGNVYTLTWPGSQGTNGQALTWGSGGGASWTSLFTNPMTTLGDVVVAGSGGTPQRLAVGSDLQVLISSATATNGVKWASLNLQDTTTVSSGFMISGWATVGSFSISVRRVGDCLRGSAYGYVTTASSTLMPAGLIIPYPIDYTKLSTTPVNYLGHVTRLGGSFASTSVGPFPLTCSTGFAMLMLGLSSGNAMGTYSSATGGITGWSANGIGFNFEVPIQGWSSFS